MDRRGPHPAHEDRVLKEALKAAKPLGLRFGILERGARQGDRRQDAVLDLRVGNRRIRYKAEIRRDLRPGMLGGAIHQMRAVGCRPLLVADHVTPPQADALKDAGIEFIDAAGNAFVKEPPLLVFVKGQRPAAREGMPAWGRAFQAAGLQVLFALLARPDLIARPYREIAAAAGVAHGTVGHVMGELRELGYLADVRGRRRLVNGERLLDRWTEAHARTLWPRLLLGRYGGDLEALQAKAAGWPQDLLIGGELAAARLTHHLRPGTATFYVEAVQPQILLALKLHKDAQGKVELRRRFWNLPGEKGVLTPTLLVYADLLTIGDARCLETAGILRGQLIARLV
jgi:hypothetical protein